MTSADKPKRRTVVVDCESTGLNPQDIAVEVGWWCLDTDQRGLFIPPHDEQWVLDNAHPDALEINGYKKRILGQPQDDGTEIRRLHQVLRGQMIGGSNIRGDVGNWLAPMFAEHGLHREPWFYHLGEIGQYACGVLGLPFEDPPGLSRLCSLLDVPPGDHTAEADVTATGLCLRDLRRRRAGITAVVNAHTNHCMQAEAVVKAPEAAA